MPIRIMHVVDSLGKGGLENGLVNVIERLDACRFEHMVLAIRKLGPVADRFPRDRVRVECLGRQTGSSRFQVATLARAMRDFEPEIVHSRNWGAIEAVIAGRWFGSCAIVHSDHGLEADAGVKEPWRRIGFRRLSYELAHRVVSVSYQLRDLHAKRTGFPATRIAVIHNGVDCRRFFPNAAARSIRLELGIPENSFCIGSVGNLLPVKDHMTLLKAVEAFSERGTDWRLLMIGEGFERPKLEAFVSARPQWKGRVSFLGSSNRVPELLNAMDVFVLPSISEGISNSLLEAMATGLPVVATATGGNPEVVVDRESGLLFPVGNWEKLAERLRLLEGRRDLRLQLGQQAVDRIHSRFSIDSMIQKYEQLYESMAPSLTAPVRAVAGV
jgi:sugar transferase (PEP-CTERM/EpsH1 system associated)